MSRFHFLFKFLTDSTPPLSQTNTTLCWVRVSVGKINFTWGWFYFFYFGIWFKGRIPVTGLCRATRHFLLDTGHPMRQPPSMPLWSIGPAIKNQRQQSIYTLLYLCDIMSFISLQEKHSNLLGGIQTKMVFILGKNKIS